MAALDTQTIFSVKHHVTSTQNEYLEAGNQMLTQKVGPYDTIRYDSG